MLRNNCFYENSDCSKTKRNLQSVKHIHSTESNSILQGEALIVVNKY